jgi:hypothetical protein
MNNPPAFPIPRHTRHFDDSQGAYMQDDGMTLRDYFAAKAMPVLTTQFYSLNQQLSEGSVPELVSKVAYEFADAMLKAREQ